MMLLLDTNIVFTFFKGESGISEKVLARIEDIALSSLVVAELDYGAKRPDNHQKRLPNVLADNALLLQSRDLDNVF